MSGRRVFRKSCGGEYSADPGFWINALQLAHRYGWQPAMQRMHYLASDVMVSVEDAQGMSEAFEQLFERALDEPEKVFPVPVDMSELFRLKEFIADSEFAIY